MLSMRGRLDSLRLRTLLMKFSRSSATFSIFALISGYSSKTSWKSIVLRTNVSHVEVAITLAMRRALVRRQISKKKDVRISKKCS